MDSAKNFNLLSEKDRNTAPLLQVEAEPETAQRAWENWHGDN